MSSLKDYRSWEKQRLHKLRREDETVYLVVEYNQCYGELITKFQIGDEGYDLPVKSRYTGNSLKCSEHNCLIGEREFENDSLTWEFLWKPMGMEHFVKDSKCCSYPLYTELYNFKRVAKEDGWESVR